MPTAATKIHWKRKKNGDGAATGSRCRVYTGDQPQSPAIAKKLAMFQLCEHPATAAGVRWLSVNTGDWTPIAASQSPVLTRHKGHRTKNVLGVSLCQLYTQFRLNPFHKDRSSTEITLSFFSSGWTTGIKIRIIPSHFFTIFGKFQITAWKLPIRIN